MVRHNNMIAHNHFHKKWQRFVRTWFDQPMKKVRRHRLREKKIKSVAPKPVEKLRPMINCPSVRYHTKLRAGKGFSLLELKSAGLSRNYAKTIGIAVDPRRRNKSLDALQRNVQRLKEYISRLIIYPKSTKKREDVAPFGPVVEGINVVKKGPSKLVALVPSEEQQNFDAFATLRKGRADVKYYGRRLKLKRIKEVGGEISERMRRKRRTQEE